MIDMDMQERAKRFSEALVTEIKAEMGRQDLSSRALGRAIGKSSQYMSDRLDGGSSKTGERVTLNARDLSAIAMALNLTEVELIERANAVISPKTPPAPVSLADRRANVSGTSEDEPDIPENVLEEWAGRYAAHPDDGEPEDHTP